MFLITIIGAYLSNAMLYIYIYIYIYNVQQDSLKKSSKTSINVTKDSSTRKTIKGYIPTFHFQCLMVNRVNAGFFWQVCIAVLAIWNEIFAFYTSNVRYADSNVNIAVPANRDALVLYRNSFREQVLKVSTSYKDKSQNFRFISCPQRYA